MRNVFWLALVIAAVGAAAAWAGGPPPMYVVVDKVVLEPNDKSPERIQIWGWFTRLESERTKDYTKPAYGFIYLGNGCAADAPKWQKAVGAGKAVAVGSCYEAGDFLTVPIHKPTDKAAKPDAAYPKGQLEVHGHLFVDERSAKQEPVKALLAAAKTERIDGEAMVKFITESVVDGLMEDGVSREFAGQLAKNPDYVGKCLLCQPAREAFVRYSELKKQSEGKGLKEDLRKRLSSPEATTRHMALRELVHTYMERGYARKTMNDEQRRTMQQLIAQHRQEGMAGLPVGQKYCPACDGAACKAPK